MSWRVPQHIHWEPVRLSVVREKPSAYQDIIRETESSLGLEPCRPKQIDRYPRKGGPHGISRLPRGGQHRSKPGRSWGKGSGSHLQPIGGGQSTGPCSAKFARPDQFIGLSVLRAADSGRTPFKKTTAPPMRVVQGCCAPDCPVSAEHLTDRTGRRRLSRGITA